MNFTTKLLFNKNTANFAVSAMQIYKTYLNAKVRGLSFTINNLKKLTLPDNSKTKEIEKANNKEEKDMKGFLKFFAVAALAALAAAVYYMYKKDKHLKNLEDMMYGEHFEDDYFDDETEDFSSYEEALEEMPAPEETI